MSATTLSNPSWHLDGRPDDDGDYSRGGIEGGCWACGNNSQDTEIETGKRAKETHVLNSATVIIRNRIDCWRMNAWPALVCIFMSMANIYNGMSEYDVCGVAEAGQIGWQIAGISWATPISHTF